MNGFVYLIINLINGKYYVGSRKGDPEVGRSKKYMGSGIAITKAIRKYGAENFVRLIVYSGPDYKYFEELMLTELNLKDNPDSYNMTNKALGSDTWSGVKRDAVFREQRRMHMLGNTITKGISLSEDHKQKISIANRGKTSAKKGQVGTPHTEEHKSHMSGVMKGNQNARGCKRSPETIAKMKDAWKRRKAATINITKGEFDVSVSADVR